MQKGDWSSGSSFGVVDKSRLMVETYAFSSFPSVLRLFLLRRVLRCFGWDRLLMYLSLLKILWVDSTLQRRFSETHMFVNQGGGVTSIRDDDVELFVFPYLVKSIGDYNGLMYRRTWMWNDRDEAGILALSR